MGWLKKIRIYAREKVAIVSSWYKKCAFLKFVVKRGAIIVSESISVMLAHLILTGLPDLTPEDPVWSGSFFTKQGEYRCERLPDGGSQVCLNTNSVVRYTFNRSTRNTELVSGEASFVVKNERRPFDVLSGGLLVHDLSTSFDVYRKRNSTQVTVIDGRIRIIVAPINSESRLKFDRAEAESAWKTAPEFHRLQQMELDEATGTLHVRPQLPEWRLSQLLAWHRRRIDLTQRPLGEAADEFSRYQPVAKFRYLDKSISKIVLDGNLDFTDLDGFLAALQQEFQIYHTKVGAGADTVVTLSRHPINTGKNHPRR